MSPVIIQVLAYAILVYFDGICASTCDDQSPKACQRLASVNRHMCKNHHVIPLCRRTCGLCPLMCYTCDAVDHPQECTHKEQCPAMNMRCIATQTITLELEKKVRLGCVTSYICSALYGTRRDVDLLGGCCDSDLCNKYDEPDRVSPPTTPAVHSPSTSNQGYSAFCHEVDSEFCKILTHDLGCHDSDVTSLCPRTCGQCTLHCYNCSSVDRPGNCRGRMTCNYEKESCIAVESYMYTHTYGYKLTCVNRKLCPGLITKGAEGTCCHNDFCNGQFIPPTTTPIPTHHTTTMQHRPHLGLPTNCHPNFRHQPCPRGFVKRESSCYHVGSSLANHDEAMDYCKKLCSRLVIISNEKENNDVTFVLMHLKDLLQLHREHHYWIDARRRAGERWIWESTNVDIHAQYSHWDQNAHIHQGCANIQWVEDERHHSGGYHWITRACVDDAVPICEIPLGDIP